MGTAASKQYLSITNWDKYQCNDRKGRHIRLYIKDYCDKDGGDLKYSRLTALQRYVFDSICRLRGRLGRNPENDATWIARATQMLHRDRTHVAQAIHRLSTDGFLTLTNHELDFSDSETDTDTETHKGFINDQFDRDDWVRQLMEDEAEIIRSIPSELTQWVTRVRPTLASVSLAEADAVKAFTAISELLVNGAARLFGNKRGSNSSLLDYDRVWDLDEKYGAGTTEALAKKILASGVATNDLHPISVRTFVWNHLPINFSTQFHRLFSSPPFIPESFPNEHDRTRTEIHHRQRKRVDRH
jgi:hypothetical protein